MAKSKAPPLKPLLPVWLCYSLAVLMAGTGCAGYLMRVPGSYVFIGLMGVLLAAPQSDGARSILWRGWHRGGR